MSSFQLFAVHNDGSKLSLGIFRYIHNAISSTSKTEEVYWNETNEIIEMANRTREMTCYYATDAAGRIRFCARPIEFDF